MGEVFTVEIPDGFDEFLGAYGGSAQAELAEQMRRRDAETLTLPYDGGEITLCLVADDCVELTNGFDDRIDGRNGHKPFSPEEYRAIADLLRRFRKGDLP